MSLHLGSMINNEENLNITETMELDQRIRTTNDTWMEMFEELKTSLTVEIKDRYLTEEKCKFHFSPCVS